MSLAGVLSRNGISATYKHQTCLPSDIVDLEDGWKQIETDGIERLKKMIREQNESDDSSSVEDLIHKKLTFFAKDSMAIYSIVFQMSNQPEPYNWASDLYERYGKAMKDFTTQDVSTEILEASIYSQNIHSPRNTMSNEQIEQYQLGFLTTVLTKANEHAFFAKWMKSFFHSLDTMVARPNQLPTLRQGAMKAFDLHVLQPHEAAIRQAVMDLIAIERDEVTTHDRKLIVRAGDDEAMACIMDEIRQKHHYHHNHHPHSQRTDTDSLDGSRTPNQRLLLVAETCEFLEIIYRSLEENKVLLLNGQVYTSTPAEQQANIRQHPRAVQLQKDFLDATREYYANKRDSTWKLLNPIHYFNLAHATIEMETERASREWRYLLLSNSQSFVDVVREELLDKAPMRPPPPTPKPADVTYLKGSKRRFFGSSSASTKSCLLYLPLIGFLIKSQRKRRAKKLQKKSKAMATGKVFMVTGEDEEVFVPSPRHSPRKKPSTNDALLCLSPAIPNEKRSFTNKKPSPLQVITTPLVKNGGDETKDDEEEDYQYYEQHSDDASSIPSLPSLSPSRMKQLEEEVVVVPDVDEYSLPADESLDEQFSTDEYEGHVSSIELLDPQENQPEDDYDDELTFEDDQDEKDDQPTAEDESESASKQDESDSLGKARQRQKQAQLNFQNMLKSAMSAPVPAGLEKEDEQGNATVVVVDETPRASNEKTEGTNAGVESAAAARPASPNPFDDDYVEPETPTNASTNSTNPFDSDPAEEEQALSPINPFDDTHEENDKVKNTDSLRVDTSHSFGVHEEKKEDDDDKSKSSGKSSKLFTSLSFGRNESKRSIIRLG